jgi:hypothetical protein
MVTRGTVFPGMGELTAVEGWARELSIYPGRGATARPSRTCSTLVTAHPGESELLISPFDSSLLTQRRLRSRFDLAEPAALDLHPGYLCAS